MRGVGGLEFAPAGGAPLSAPWGDGATRVGFILRFARSPAAAPPRVAVATLGAAAALAAGRGAQLRGGKACVSVLSREILLTPVLTLQLQLLAQPRAPSPLRAPLLTLAPAALAVGAGAGGVVGVSHAFSSSANRTAARGSDAASAERTPSRTAGSIRETLAKNGSKIEKDNSKDTHLY